MSEVSPSNYDTLIIRIRVHCQQAVWNMGSNSYEVIQGEDYIGWYVPTRKTFLVLKKQNNGQESSLAFLPATEQQIKETEQQLGFPLPHLLRLLYTQIANGGFGPGYGIIGAVNGFPSLDSPYGDIAQTYYQEINEANEQRQRRIRAFLKADQADVEASRRTSNKQEKKILRRIAPDGTVHPEWERALTPMWSEHLLPFCEWGEDIRTYIHTDTGQIFQGVVLDP